MILATIKLELIRRPSILHILLLLKMETTALLFKYTILGLVFSYGYVWNGDASG